MQIITTVWSSYDVLDWFNASDSIGYSITTGIVYFVFFFYFYNGKASYIYWMSSLCLILMNMFSWLGSIIYYKEYGLVYDAGVVFVFMWLIFFIWLKKRRDERDYITVYTPK